ncbi:uncharacterized protein LOC110443502 [Mizuhopecten yessoensis]|uniref:Fibronectin type-III domain-containing protein n=1 Tax=Mizuhopecten yessoensis TaxID=6573 RepID=A0A210R0P8_MIZYE|nr:uncharacterized protein LOC110443502 [Mizuhopecten yessoensis]OWF54532.1 hypothetical protein KP79_PYT13410 [Mizuhopecten yessoensis]
MSTVEERYSGEVVGCDIGDVTLQIHLPCDDDEEFDEFPDNEPLLRNCNGGPSKKAPSTGEGHVASQTSRTNGRRLPRRQISAPTNVTGSLGICNGNELPYNPRPPPITRRQTMPSNLTQAVTECPRDVILEENVYEISETSPTQINITWTPPSNFNEIPKLVYELQLKKENDGDWLNLSDRGIPIVRVYTTETRFILDGERRTFSEGQCTWWLRIRAVSKGQYIRIEGPWSKDITLNILGNVSHVPIGGTP